MLLGLYSSMDLGWGFALGCVEEYACATKTLAPFALTLASSKTMNVLQVFHPLDLSSPY